MSNTEEIDQKILYLKDMMSKDPDRNVGSILRVINELFQLNQKGISMPPEKMDFLNESARKVISPELNKTLSKLRLEGYGFIFAAMNFVDLEDVLDDLSNGGEILKSTTSFPPGAFNKLKRELLGSTNQAVQEPIQNKETEIPREEPVRERVLEKAHVVEEKAQPETKKKNQKLELLQKYLQKCPENKGKVLGALIDFVSDDQLSTITSSDDVKDLVKQAASVILSPEVLELLEKLYLEEYSYVLAVNYITDLNALADDVFDGDLLQRTLPKAAFNNLKRELSTKKTLPEPPVQEAIINQTTESIPFYDEAISLPDTTLEIKIRLATQIKESHRSRYLGKNQTGMEIFQLGLTRKTATSVSKTERWIFGTPTKTNVKCRTILLMGATGSGKTTLINSMVNYILDVEWDDPFRFVLIREEETSSNQAHSQTSSVTAYELHYEAGFRVPYSLIIVDTPGYGDTKGVTRDHQITENIQQFFQDEKGIQV